MRRWWAADELGLVALGVLSLVLIFNTLDGDFIAHPMAFATSVGCVVGLFRLKACQHRRRLAGLLALCLLAAVLGVLSARFRDTMHAAALLFWRAQNHFGPMVIAPIDARHVSGIDDRSVDEGRALYTHHARRFIEASQARVCHAANNHTTRVFQVGAYRSGMGSELHFHAAVLAHAIEQRALFEWGPGACALFGAHCRALYQPEHRCPAERVRRMRVVHFTQDDWPVEQVPRALLDLLPKTFTVQQALFWWRAQAIGYFMRFGPETRTRIDALRAGQAVRLGGAINVNLRGGDKVGEARPIAPERYIDKALDLMELAPLTYSRVLFLTSDDPRELARAHAYATVRGLKAVYLDVPRMRHGNAESQVAAFWTYNVTLSVLLQLSMTAECAAWIGSRTSNWNRVIDMYRCTVAANCRGVFVEMEDAIRGYYYTRPAGQF